LSAEQCVLIGERAIAELDIGADIHTAYVSGSLLFGLGNAGSDVDLFVVVDGATQVGHYATPVVVDHVLVDCEVVDRSYLRHLARRFAAPEITLNNLLGDSLALLREADLICRLIGGRPVFGETEFAALRREVSEAQVRRTILAALSGALGPLFADYAGARAAGDEMTADFCARALMTDAAMALTCALLPPYVSRKFARSRLARVHTVEDAADFAWQLETTRSQGVDRWLQDRWLVAQGTLATAHMLAHGNVSTASHLPTRPLGDGPIRHPRLYLMPVDNEWYLLGGPPLVISRLAAVVWTIADGRPIDSTYEAVAAISRRPLSRVVTGVERAYDLLTRRQALVSRAAADF
jgi:hypothetical protein